MQITQTNLVNYLHEWHDLDENGDSRVNITPTPSLLFTLQDGSNVLRNLLPLAGGNFVDTPYIFLSSVVVGDNPGNVQAVGAESAQPVDDFRLQFPG